TAAAAGVILNIGELSRLEKFGRFAPGSPVCIRLNPQVGAGHHEHVITAGERSKFGVPVEDIERIHEIARRHDLRIVGLHQHIGSGIMSTDTLWKAMSVLLDVAESFPNVRFLNFGGGLGIPYRADELPLDLENFGRRILEPLREFAREHPSEDLSFWFEPGRFLVAEAGVLLVRVNTLKENRGRVFAGTDSGMGHLVRPAIYGAYHAIYNLSNPGGSYRTYDVTGNICESGDLFAREREIAEIREGDVLAILDVGAYGMAMASEYNLRPLPAEVLLGSDGEAVVVRERRSPEELVEEMLGGRSREK
ncbi:MAG: diaminopimelate decarboxylase, partial [Rhodothermales bacterium]